MTEGNALCKGALEASSCRLASVDASSLVVPFSYEIERRHLAYAQRQRVKFRFGLEILRPCSISSNANLKQVSIQFSLVLRDCQGLIHIDTSLVSRRWNYHSVLAPNPSV